MEHFVFSKEKHRIEGLNIIKDYPFITAFGHERYLDIRPTLPLHYNKGIEICYVTKGRYEWSVDKEKHILYPGDGFVTCPWQFHGSERGVIELGEIWWLIISPKIFNKKGKFHLADWSCFSKQEEQAISDALLNNHHPILYKSSELNDLFTALYHELITKEFGYEVKIHHLIEIILMTVVRLIRNRENIEVKDMELITRLEKQLKENLGSKWSVGKMAAANNMGTTSFNEKIKKITGYTPSSYLIQLRIAEAKKQLLNTDKSITDIALDCGFSSSQHFSGTFMKRIGISPTNYRSN